jgi:uncharacterized protein YuzE
MVDEITIEKRRAILQNEINSYIKKGFRVISQTDTTAQLLNPKKFSLLWAVLWFLLFGVGILIYLFYYLAKRDEQIYDEQIYIEITPTGKVIARKT